jgi:alkanesulfonate monooxygenase SsuD/methylene tetrahydromethanopterin reductase-like flavin-dependent oxidoreductase (luciferase family)
VGAGAIDRRPQERRPGRSTKVRPVNYQGKFFSTRGPLNSGPAPQGQPVIAQAGGSPRGRKFAAAHADTIVVHVKGIEAMKAYREDVHKHMIAQGRKPADCKVLFLINPILGETEEEAKTRKKARIARTLEHIEERLAHFGRSPTSTSAGSTSTSRCPSMSRPTATSRTSSSTARSPTAARSARPWRASTPSTCRSSSVGTPDSVAARMGEVMEEVGGDGFLFSMPNVNRRTLAEIEDGLIPPCRIAA